MCFFFLSESLICAQPYTSRTMKGYGWRGDITGGVWRGERGGEGEKKKEKKVKICNFVSWIFLVKG